MICKELNKEFNTDKELFKALKQNKSEIISFKKSQVFKSIDKGVSVKTNKLDISKVSGALKGQFSDEDYYYIAVNTTKILDSHSDLHVDGIWNKTAKEQNRKNALVDSHEMSLKTTIARRQNVEMFVADIPFSMIGKDYEGETQALIYKIHKDNIREEYKEFLQDGSDIEASVRMQYVNIELAMNSTEKDDEREKKVYDDNINKIANKSDFEDIKYFWVVSEAKNIGESSLVLNGSNHATGMIQNEPSNDTQEQKTEAVNNDTSQDSNFYNII
jgi:hypothetical protein